MSESKTAAAPSLPGTCHAPEAAPVRQTQSLAEAVDVASIASTYHLDQPSIPPRNSSLDWAYGDTREVLAVTQYLSSSLQRYCLHRVGGHYDALLDDDACADSVWPYPQGFPNYFTSFEMALQLLTSYGVSGDVTASSMTIYGLEVQTSLIGRDMSLEEKAVAPPAVRYCSPLPAAGKDGASSGIEVADYILQAGLACSGPRSRRSGPSLGALDSEDTSGTASAGQGSGQSLQVGPIDAMQVPQLS